MQRQMEIGGARIEWLILADAAQVVGNKLFLLGGGWDVLNVHQPLPIQHVMAVALSVKVPWHQTNQRHHVELEIVTDDGDKLATIGGFIEMGRPPGIRPGQEQRSQLAFNIGLKLEKPGMYVIVGRLEGDEQARTHFTVVPDPGVPSPRQGQRQQGE